jgi:hypothetical protein
MMMLRASAPGSMTRADETSLVRIMLFQSFTERQVALTNITTEKRDATMLWTIAVVLIVLWALGFLAFHVTTGFIHLLLLVAAVVLVLQLVSGRRGVV